MSQKIEEWLGRMRQAKNPGPVVRITAARNNRDVGWVFDVDEDSDLSELAERIDNAGRDAGFVGTYELRAFDEEERFIAPLAHRVQATEIVPAGLGGPPALPMSVEATVDAALQNSRAFTTLGLESIMKAQRATERMMNRLEDENTELRKENARLRTKLVEHWELMEKLNTHELETKQEKDKVERMGRMGENLVNAVMARVLGRGATPEGQTMEHRMAMTLFRSLAHDLDRANKILPLLTDEERVLVMELMRPQDPAPAVPGPPIANGMDAAAAAAAVNVNGAREGAA
jgi:hypothetical protein